MVRWVKLFGNQYLGFWGLGLVLFALQELPYMLMPLFHLETNPIMKMTEASVILDICEKVLGSLCIALMVFIVHRDAKLFSVSDGRENCSSHWRLFCCWRIMPDGHCISPAIRAFS